MQTVVDQRNRLVLDRHRRGEKVKNKLSIEVSPSHTGVRLVQRCRHQPTGPRYSSSRSRSSDRSQTSCYWIIAGRPRRQGSGYDGRTHRAGRPSPHVGFVFSTSAPFGT